MDDSLNFALSCFYEEQVRLLETESERKREEAAREISVRVSDLRMEVTKELDDCISEMNKLDSELAAKREGIKKRAHQLISTLHTQEIRKIKEKANNETGMITNHFRSQVLFNGDDGTKHEQDALLLINTSTEVEIKFIEEETRSSRSAIDSLFLSISRNSNDNNNINNDNNNNNNNNNFDHLSKQILLVLQSLTQKLSTRSETSSLLASNSLSDFYDSTISSLSQSLASLAVKSEYEEKHKKELNKKQEEIRQAQVEREISLFSKLDKPRASFSIGVLSSGQNPTTIKILINDDFNTFNKDSFRQKLCKELNIDRSLFKINDVQAGSVIVIGEIIGEEATRKVMEAMKDIDNPVASDFKIKEILLGDFGLNLNDAVMNVKWNKIYDQRNTFWKGRMKDNWDRGDKPYYCPVGWKRYSIKVLPDDEFEKAYNGWYVGYHGTAGTNASSILATGLRPGRGVYTNGVAVYLSPSIEYSAHPRFATPWKMPNGKIVQMIFQCRVNPEAIFENPKPETLGVGDTVVIDPHFSNKELEWVIQGVRGQINNLANQVVCYGVMLRENDNPLSLPSSHWWKISGAEKYIPK